MPIQLLYIIPVVALSLLIPIMILTHQRQTPEPDEEKGTEDLSRQVDEFNNGRRSRPVRGRELPEAHVSEIEKTIKLVTKALSSQQKIIERFQGVNANYTDELDKLKGRLRELQKEYDILLSENYSLRAKMRKLTERSAGAPAAVAQEFEIHQAGSGTTQTTNRDARQTVLDDTQVLGGPSLDDTTEINLADLKGLI